MKHDTSLNMYDSYTGCTGATGCCDDCCQGPPGPQGIQGNQGVQGIQGIQGMQGMQGMRGCKGDTGPQGLVGDTGPTGNQGEMGNTGCTGNQGNTGSTGPQGLIGYTGATGLGYAGVIASNDTTSQYGIQVWNVNKIGAYNVGDRVQVAWVLNPADYMQGYIIAIDPILLTITVDADTVSGPQGIPWDPWFFSLCGIPGQIGKTGPTGPTGTTGDVGPTGPMGIIGPIGNYLRVDSVYGNDADALLQPYTLSFKTIGAALASAMAGQEVFVYPGVYNEIITIPVNVCLKGADQLTTIIQCFDPIVATTVVTLNQYSRIEDFTINLYITNALNSGPYICVDYLSGASINAKVRGCKLTPTLLNGDANIYAVKSSGVSSLLITSSNAIRASTMQVNSNSNLKSRCILINGPNRFVARDCVLFCNGAGSDLVSCETDDSDAILSIKSSTLNGYTYDILQTQGTVIIGVSDLINHTAPFSFTCDIQPTTIYFGLIGYPGGNLTYHLPPGITPISSVYTVIPYTFNFAFPTIITSMNATYLGNIIPGDSLTFEIYKNNILTGLSVVFTTFSPTVLIVTNIGITFLPTDIIDARLTTVGNPNTQTFTASINLY